MNYHRGIQWQQGAGIGSLFSGLFRGLMPVAKSAIKGIGRVVKSDAVKAAGRTLKKEATKAAVETALEALDGKRVGSSAKQRLKNATRGILLNAARKADSNNSLPPPRKKKRRQRNIRASRRKRGPLFTDDDY